MNNEELQKAAEKMRKTVQPNVERHLRNLLIYGYSATKVYNKDGNVVCVDMTPYLVDDA